MVLGFGRVKEGVSDELGNEPAERDDAKFTFQEFHLASQGATGTQVLSQSCCLYRDVVSSAGREVTWFLAAPRSTLPFFQSFSQFLQTPYALSVGIFSSSV